MISKENKSILDKAILSGEGNLWQRIIASSDKRLKCSSKTTYVLSDYQQYLKHFKNEESTHYINYNRMLQ